MNELSEEQKKSFENINNLYRVEAAKSAWQIGKEINKLHDEYPKKGIFFKWFSGQSPYWSTDTAMRYMKIHKLIPLESIEKAPNILVGHLNFLIKMDKEERQVFLEAMSLVENDDYIKQRNLKLKNFYRIDYISIFQNLRREYPTKYNSPEKIKKYIVHELIAPLVREQKERQPLNNSKKGQLITSNYFDLSIHPCAPTDEQGLVGLFCTIFHFINNKHYHFGLKKETMFFGRINKIKTSFPDGEIECYICDSDGNKMGKDYRLFVEFEYQSSTYLTHNHDKAVKKECEMIICWENNWGKNKPYIHILSIKELLEMGKINLHY